MFTLAVESYFEFLISGYLTVVSLNYIDEYDQNVVFGRRLFVKPKIGDFEGEWLSLYFSFFGLVVGLIIYPVALVWVLFKPLKYIRSKPF